MRLVAVLDADEHPAAVGQLGEGAQLALGKGGGEIGINAHHFAGGAHFGAQHRVHTGEAGKGKHRFLHGNVIADVAGRQIKIRQTFASHHARGNLGNRNAGGLGGERHGAAGARVDLDQKDHAFLHRELHVHQALHLEGSGQHRGLPLDLGNYVGGEAVGRQAAGAVAAVHTGLLDMLQDAGDIDRLAIGHGVHIHFDGIAQIPVDQHRRTARNHHRLANICLQLGAGVDNLHGTPAKHIGWPHQHRIADGFGHLHGLLGAAGDAVIRLFQAELVDQRRKALAIFGQIDAVRAGTQDRNAGILQGSGKFKGCLAAQLHHHTDQFTILLLGVEDFQHVLSRQRLEIQPVRRVIIGGDGFRVAVDHDGFEPGITKREAGVAAAIIKFDALPDAVRPAAQDDDLLRRRRVALAVRHTKARRFVTAVHIGRLGREFAGAGVDALEHRPHIDGAAGGGNLGLAGAGQRRQPSIGKAHGFQAAKALRIHRQAIDAHAGLHLHQLLHLAQEPGFELGDLVDALHAHAGAQRIGRHQQPVRRRLRQRGFDFLDGGAFQGVHLVKARQSGFQTAQRLLHAFLPVAADGHHLAHRFHRRAEQRRRALELLKGKARDLGDDIVDGWFETGRRGAGDVVHDLVERVTHRQQRRDLGDREARGLGRQRRRARHARVHFDDDQAAILGVHGKLHIGTTGFHANLAQHRDAGVAHDLIFLVGQRQRRGDGDAVPGVDAHRIDILDRADDDGIVRLVADHLHLILLPAQHAFFHQHFGGGAGIEAAGDDTDELLAVIGDAAAGAAHGEAGADDRGQAHLLQRRQRLINAVGDAALRAFQPDLVHGIAEFQPVLGLVDGLGVRPDQLDAVFFQRAILGQRQRGVERRLPAHGGQHGIRPLLLDDARDDFGRDRLHIGRVRQLRIGHDRRRVGIDQDDAIALGLQRLHRLCARIIELAGLADDDRAGANDQDGFDVGAFGHQSSSPVSA